MKKIFFYGYSIILRKKGDKEFPFSVLYYISGIAIPNLMTLIIVGSLLLGYELSRSFSFFALCLGPIIFAYFYSFYYYDKHDLYKELIGEFYRLPKAKQEQYMVRGILILLGSFALMFGTFILLDYKYHHS